MRTLPVLLLLALVAGCASAPASERRTPDRLTQSEIHGSDLGNAYDIVRTLRPRWLQRRGPSSVYYENPIVVYVDGMRMGGPEALEQIPRMAIRGMRYFSGPEAQARWGLNHTNGAIAVYTGV